MTDSLREAYEPSRAFHAALEEARVKVGSADDAFESELAVTTFGSFVAAEAEKLAGFSEEQYLEDFEAAVRPLCDLEEGYDSEAVEAAERRVNDSTMGRLSVSYLSVLSAVRPFGAQLSVSFNSETVSSEPYLTRAAALLPSDWLEASNFCGAFSVVEADRPLYAHQYEAPLRTVVCDLEARRYLLSNVLRKYEVLYDGGSGAEDSMIVVECHPEEYSVEAACPAGSGWLYGQCLSYTLDGSLPVELLAERAAESVWFRQVEVAAAAPSLGFYRSEVADNLKPSTLVSTLVHELCHRVESTHKVSRIVEAERAFLLRRSGKTFDNRCEHMFELDTGEYAHEGNFVDPYFGRDYFKGEHFEVLSTGVESLLGGAYGGLLGLSSSWLSTDHDHRAFTLGALALL